MTLLVDPLACCISPCSLPHSSLPLSVIFLLTETLARRAQRRFGHCKAHLASSLVASSPPCRVEHACLRNRPRSPCIARAVAVSFSDPDELHRRFRPPCTPSALAKLARSSWVSSCTSLCPFPPPSLRGSSVRRSPWPPSFALVAGVDSVGPWKRRR